MLKYISFSVDNESQTTSNLYSASCREVRVIGGTITPVNHYVGYYFYCRLKHVSKNLSRLQNYLILNACVFKDHSCCNNFNQNFDIWCQ